jgi:hypothetical protein
MKQPAMKKGGMALLILIIGVLSILGACATASSRGGSAGIVEVAATSSTFDMALDKPIDITSQFAPTDRSIYLAVSLKDFRPGSRCEFVRYLDDKYLDHGSVIVTKVPPTTVAFEWSLRQAGARRLEGLYRVKVYLNGVYKTEISYRVGG